MGEEEGRTIDLDEVRVEMLSVVTQLGIENIHEEMRSMAYERRWTSHKEMQINISANSQYEVTREESGQDVTREMDTNLVR